MYVNKLVDLLPVALVDSNPYDMFVLKVHESNVSIRNRKKA